MGLGRSDNQAPAGAAETGFEATHKKQVIPQNPQPLYKREINHLHRIIRAKVGKAGSTNHPPPVSGPTAPASASHHAEIFFNARKMHIILPVKHGQQGIVLKYHADARCRIVMTVITVFRVFFFH